MTRLGRNDLSAYLVMMAARLVELRRVLTPTGSLYLHCDLTASHYLKTVLDVLFEPQNFRTEIIWQRTNVHSDSKTWSRVTDPSPTKPLDGRPFRSGVRWCSGQPELQAARQERWSARR